MKRPIRRSALDETPYPSIRYPLTRSQDAIEDRRAAERDRRTEEERTAKLQRFAGRWIVLERDEVVLAAESASEEAAVARARGIKVPHLLFVEPISRNTAKMGL
jgi:hypothetical protein